MNMKVTVIPTEVGSIGIVPEGLRLEELKIRGILESTQITTL